MPEHASIDPGTLSDLCEAFKVSKATCEYYNQYYNDKILPRIQRNYLAHLVVSIEEIIDEKIKNDIKKNDPKDTSDRKTRDFSIVLHPDPPPQGKEAVAECLPTRAYIKYKPTKDYKKLRIIIAHELGHVLRNYKIILGNDPENHANLFAYLAISGKNKFYKSKVEDLIYPNETDIIRKIQAVCQIEEYRQIDKISPIKNEGHI